MPASVIKTIVAWLLGMIIISFISINIYETYFGVDARFNKRMQEYYRFNIQNKCGIVDNDYMTKVWLKISYCLDDKDRTIQNLNEIIHQI